MDFELLVPGGMTDDDLDSRATIEAKECCGSNQDEGAQDHCLAQLSCKFCSDPGKARNLFAMTNAAESSPLS
jgi:hypothetical protein